ncbi:MAG: hypothetical protein KKE89_03785, partial [Actinobacteria bacterium]|nr:hypothetical protein [Actinomycetota bacterium]
ITTRSVLKKAGMTFDERPIQVIQLPHKPGALATMARDLADAGINIDAVYLLRSSAEGLDFAIGVDDPEAAAERFRR